MTTVSAAKPPRLIRRSPTRKNSQMSHRTLLLALLFSLCANASVLAEDRIFSGPQVGEKLPPLKVRGVFEPHTGKELDLVAAAAGKPIVLVFIHDVNRPSLQMTKILTYYTAGLASQGVATGVVWLADDVTEAENVLKKRARELSREVPTGLSLDGLEGPGSYGLNRNVTLTILIGNAGRVTANFALVQPSIATDLPKILEGIANVTQRPPATMADLLCVSSNTFRGSILYSIDRSATPAEVDLAAASIEQAMKKDPASREELKRMLRHVIETGQLESHGTPRAREYLRKLDLELSPPVVPENVSKS